MLIELLEMRQMLSVDLSNIGIGAFSTGVYSLSGKVFLDQDRNGSTSDRLKQPDVGIPGVRVYVDRDDDGHRDKKEPTALTDADGGYLLNDVHQTDLQATIRCVAPDGYQPTTPMEQTGNSAAFGLWKQRTTASIATDVILSPALNQSQSTGETAPTVQVPGVRVYLDLDRDGKRDRKEPQALTTGGGRVLFGRLFPGSYLLRVATPAGFAVDGTKAELRVGDRQRRTHLFSLTGTRTVHFNFFSDANGNGLRDAGELPAENSNRAYVNSGSPFGVRVIAEYVTSLTSRTATLPRIAATVLYLDNGTPLHVRLPADATSIDLPLPVA